MAGLLLFVALYCSLAGWFLYTAYQVMIGGAGSDLGIFAWLMALCSLFLGVFMVKAIFSVKNATPAGLHEITAKDQARLFEFLFELADAAGAPRPHKVFLSTRVNAAVFYDLSLFNLIVPSRKNLEIGLALVNTLSLGELRAVLAHEFGHFAQRSMAVGRWVYVAQQIANHLVTRRDALDDFLVGLARLDLRIHAVVAVVQLVIWSIRSLVESLFSLVVMMQRALSREMEMQADLVAVSLTGSDALVHALHKLQGADDAWDRTLHFVFGEQAAGRATRDVFAVQSHMISRMSAILHDDGYARVPELPPQGQDRHRVFTVELAQPPRMWQTHPLNHEREENAKRIYVPAPIDPASAWSLFEYPALLRTEMTGKLLAEAEGEAAAVELEESLKTLGRQFKREHFNRRYCGIFFGRPLARHASNYEQLRDPRRASDIGELPGLYPESLARDVQALRGLESQHAQLEALIAGTMKATGKRVRVLGLEFRKKDLPAARDSVRAEMDAVTGRLRDHDKLCRSWHQAFAGKMGGQWQAYLDGLLALIHYAEHTAADLEDAQGLLNNTTAVVTALGKVNDKGIDRILASANMLHSLLQTVYAKAPEVALDAALSSRMEVNSWEQSLGEFTLPQAYSDNINGWLNASANWVAGTVNALNSLRSAALEELLVTETMIAMHARTGAEVSQAPSPSRAPAHYATLLPGAERARQTTLGWWARFQRADGLLPGAARLAVAGGIVAAVLGASSFNEGHGTSVFGAEPSLMVYNGFDMPVVANVDGRSVTVAPHSAAPLPLPLFGKHHVEARTADGHIIESFDAQAKKGGHPVYNVAGATPLVEWSASYGMNAERPQRNLGAARWLDSSADDVFRAPPEKVSGRGPSYRTVLDGAAGAAPEMQLQLIEDEKERKRVALLHVRWDPTSSRNIQAWFDSLGPIPELRAAVAQRLKEAPADVLLLREEFDAAEEGQHQALCARAGARSRAAPSDGNLKYLALRCQDESDALAAEVLQAAARWPDNPWLGYTAAYDALEHGNWKEGLAGLELASVKLPARAPVLASDIGRVRRYLDPAADLSKLAEQSVYLGYLLRVEAGGDTLPAPMRAYTALDSGQLEAALNHAKGNELESYIVRMVAASDGASPEMIARALALPPEANGNSPAGIIGLALAMRKGAGVAPHSEALIKGSRRYGAAVVAFIESVRKGADPRASEKLLANVPVQLRGYAYSAAIVVAGRKAPPEWREFVKRMLFKVERPYFAA